VAVEGKPGAYPAGGKNTAITERVHAVFTDFFNIFNHPIFCDPGVANGNALSNCNGSLSFASGNLANLRRHRQPVCPEPTALRAAAGFSAACDSSLSRSASTYWRRRACLIDPSGAEAVVL